MTSLRLYLIKPIFTFNIIQTNLTGPNLAQPFISVPNTGPAEDLLSTLKKTQEVDFIPPIETFGFILNDYLASLRLWLIKPILAFNILMEPNLTEPNLTWTNFI